MNIRGFHHLAIQVRSLERMSAFYRDVLGLREVARHQREDGSVRSIWMGLPGAFLALEEVEGEPGAEPFRHPRPGLFLLGLRIDASAREDVRRALHAHGVAVEHESKWTLYLRDPEGNRLGLSHHPDGHSP
jgi:catechol 2,3-dioxygenase-like lactoylglutathione lyase family enzyme